MANFNQNSVFSGLGSYSTTVPFAGTYFVEGKSTIPTLVNGGGVSALLAVINLNGSPVYTGIAGNEGFRCDVACAALDVIQIVLSSSAAADQPANSIKTVIALGIGE